MKIAIIGGGWVGCHLASKLKNNHDIVIFDKNEELFLETSYNNQNRLHIGYHYPRNHQTRDLCKNTFYRFINEYGFLVKDVNPNLYSISSDKSLLDFNTYIKIFDKYNFTILNSEDYNLTNIEGTISTNEKHINFKNAYDFFNQNLKIYHVKRNILKNNIEEIKKEYDLVINATNNHIVDNNINNYFYELTLTLIYKKVKETKFESLTIMDGKFLSIYPYVDDLYTLTDVKHTPLEIFTNIDDLNIYKSNIDQSYISNKKNIFENKVKKYFNDFDEHYNYHSYFLSTKSKIISNSDNRYPIITIEDNLINCFTGKIQGIYVIEDYINNIINENSTIL